jgi:hypothetical protein
MKQLFTYISPDHGFNTEHQMMVKIQIDNSLVLGWDLQDILLFTNFPYEYNGVAATVLGDELYCRHPWTATKIFVIDHLLQAGMINELTWYHDFDCWQFSPLLDIVDDMEDYSFGITNYGRMPRLASPSMFFTAGAKDFFAWVKNEVVTTKCNEEMAIMRALYEKKLFPYKHLDITYAFHRHNLNHVYERARKPIVAAHFHPTTDKYDIFVRGISKLGFPLVPERLVNIFHQHGFDR